MRVSGDRLLGEEAASSRADAGEEAASSRADAGDGTGVAMRMIPPGLSPRTATAASNGVLSDGGTATWQFASRLQTGQNGRLVVNHWSTQSR